MIHISKPQDSLSALFYFLAGAATATALTFLSKVRSAHKVRREASVMATVERLDGRAEIPALREVPASFGPLESARQELSLHQGGPITVLLVGPPSVGKTRSVRSFVAHTGVPALFVQVHSLLSQAPQYLDARIKDLATRAAALSPAIVVLDGIDEAQGEALTKITEEILQIRSRLLVIGTARQEVPGFGALVQL